MIDNYTLNDEGQISSLLSENIYITTSRTYQAVRRFELRHSISMTPDDLVPQLKEKI